MVIDAPWYQALFPGMRPAKDSGTELVTTAGGSRYATSVGGTLTGRGADLIIVDDEELARRGIELRLRAHADIEIVAQDRKSTRLNSSHT